MREYYHGQFRTDLRAFMPRTDVPYFGHSWHIDCAGLDRVPPERRPQFLVCLYFTVLVDQAVHAHFRHLHPRFEALTRYPKFCHGLGQFHKNPREIMDAPFERGLVGRDALRAAIRHGIDLFVDEVVHFCATQMPELKPEELFRGILSDSDVAIPLLVVMLEPKLKEYPGWEAFECLREAVTSKFPKRA